MVVIGGLFIQIIRRATIVIVFNETGQPGETKISLARVVIERRRMAGASTTL
jgi:hypothetical protein